MSQQRRPPPDYRRRGGYGYDRRFERDYNPYYNRFPDRDHRFDRQDRPYYDRKPIFERQYHQPHQPQYFQRQRYPLPPQRPLPHQRTGPPSKPAMWERPPERPSIIKKEEPVVEVAPQSSSESDEDGYDQDMIEEQIDRIDNEITKQERILQQIRARRQEQTAVEVVKVVSKISNDKLGIRLGDCVLPKRQIEPNTQSVDLDQLVKDIYVQNQQLLSQVRTKQMERDWMVYHLSNPDDKTEPTYDPTIWEKKLEVKPKTHAAIVAFLNAKQKQKVTELERRICEYKTLKERWLEQTAILEREMSERQERTKVEVVPRGRRGMGFHKGDVVRNDQEWTRALQMLGIQEQKDIYAKEIPMLPRSDIQRIYRFENNNDLVVDPENDLKNFNALQDSKWSDYDQQLFRSLLSQHGKDFFKIGTAMRKQTHECVWYYYKEKVNNRFKNLLKRRGKKRKDVVLGKPEMRVYELDDDEVAVVCGYESDDDARSDDDSLGDLLGTWTCEQLDKLTKILADTFDFSIASKQLQKPTMICKLAYRFLKRNDLTIFGISEKEEKKYHRKKKKELGEEGDDDGKVKKRKRQVSEDESRKTISYWSVHERTHFVELLQQYGRDWDTISNEIGTKSAIQVRNYFINARKRGEFEQFENQDEEARIPKIRLKVSHDGPVEVEIVKDQALNSIKEQDAMEIVTRDEKELEVANHMATILGHNLENPSNMVQQEQAFSHSKKDVLMSIPVEQLLRPQLPSTSNFANPLNIEKLTNGASGSVQFNTFKRSVTPEFARHQSPDIHAVGRRASDSMTQRANLQSTDIHTVRLKVPLDQKPNQDSFDDTATPSRPTERIVSQEPKKVRVTIVEKKMSISSMLNDEPPSPAVILANTHASAVPNPIHMLPHITHAISISNEYPKDTSTSNATIPAIAPSTSDTAKDATIGTTLGLSNLEDHTNKNE